MYRFVLLHDAIPIVLDDYFFNMKIRNSWFKQLFNTLNEKDYYFTNSEYTKQDFIKYCDKLNPEHITTTLLGANENFYPVSDEFRLRVKIIKSFPDRIALLIFK